MSHPTREEVEAFINALRYGMKVSHKPEFLIAMAEGWLKSKEPDREECVHDWSLIQYMGSGVKDKICRKCQKIVEHISQEEGEQMTDTVECKHSWEYLGSGVKICLSCHRREK